MTALFGVVDQPQVEHARDHGRRPPASPHAPVSHASRPVPPATGVRAGTRRLPGPPSTTSEPLDIRGGRVLALTSLEGSGQPLSRLAGSSSTCSLADRLDWLTSTADVEARRLTVDVNPPLGGSPARPRARRQCVLYHGRASCCAGPHSVSCSISAPYLDTFARGRLLHQVPLVLRVAVRRLTADAEAATDAAASGPRSCSLSTLGLVPARARPSTPSSSQSPTPRASSVPGSSSAGATVSTALDPVLGPAGPSLSLAASQVSVEGRDPTAPAPSATTPTSASRPQDSPAPYVLRPVKLLPLTTGTVQQVIDLAPSRRTFDWRHPHTEHRCRCSTSSLA